MKITNQIVIEKAKELGFDLIGFAKAELLEIESRKLNEWLKRKFHSTMEYMERNTDKRKDVKKILPGARSIISLAMNYNTDHHHENKNGYGKISRYAWGKDYHLIIWDKLEILEEMLEQIDPKFKSISYVDTGPVMDKAWAVRAGIGWLGKHTNVITKELGSWVFLATIITNYEFEYSRPVEDFCGTCRTCIDACPTKAIVDEYIVDANRCISYLTIENKGEISKEFKNNFDNWLFGCDVCQDVCPWNKKFSVVTGTKEFEPVNKEFKIEEVIQLQNEEFKKRFETSPLKRAKLKGLIRNAEFLKNNSKSV